MGLLWGMMGSSAIMSHIYSIYLQRSKARSGSCILSLSEYLGVGGGKRLKKRLGSVEDLFHDSGVKSKYDKI